MRLDVVRLEYPGMFLKRPLSWWQLVLSQLYGPFSINGAVTRVQVTHAMGTNTPPYQHRRRQQSGLSLSSLPPMTREPRLPNTVRCYSSDFFSRVQLSSGLEKLAVFLHVDDRWPAFLWKNLNVHWVTMTSVPCCVFNVVPPEQSQSVSMSIKGWPYMQTSPNM